MSNYIKVTRNPATKVFETAYWMDDYFGRHRYGVRFDDGGVYMEETFTDEDFLSPEEETAFLWAKSSDIETWEDVARIVSMMTPEQRKQPVQCVLGNSDADAVQECLVGVSINTVEKFEFSACRSVHNNKYCPDDIVMLLDVNPYAEDGTAAWDWSDPEKETPIYEKDGPTKPEDQRPPK